MDSIIGRGNSRGWTLARRAFACLMCAVLLIGTLPVQAAPEQTEPPSPSPSRTATPSPSRTAAPNPTLVPSATATPTPTPAPSPSAPVVNIPAEKIVQAADGSQYKLTASAFDFILTPAPGNPSADPVKEPIHLTNEANGVIQVLTGVTYTEAGTYHYVLEENFRPMPGMQFTDRGFLITVQVEPVDGALQANVLVTNKEGEQVGLEGLRFVNIYNPADISVAIPGTKTLDGDVLSEGQFTFRIEPVSAVVEELPAQTELRAAESATPEPGPSAVAPEQPAASVSAPPTEDSTPELEETQTPEEPSALSNQTEAPDEAEEASAESDSEETDGQDASGVQAEEKPDAAASEENLPQATEEPAEAMLEPARTHEPAPAVTQARAAETAFATAEPSTQAEPLMVMLPINEIPMPTETTVSNSAAGTFHFGAIHFTRPGTYTYRVTEVAGTEPNMTYDGTGYTVTVTVVRNEAGELVATVAVEGAEDIVFRNTKDLPKLAIEKDQNRNNGEWTKELLHCQAGNTVTYRLLVTNPSAVTATDVIVTDKVPTGLILLPETISSGGTVAGDVITWNLGDIEPGGQRIVNFAVRIPSVTAYTRWTNVSSVTYENNPENGPDGRAPIPSNPVEVDAQPVTPNQNTTTTTTGSGRSPGTDDTANLGLWVTLLIVSAGVIVGSAWLIHRDNRRRAAAGAGRGR